MTHFIPIGVGAGLVSALLLATVTQGSALALVLYLLAPIPILVAALGWDHRAGIVGAVAGGLALSVALAPAIGLVFALATAIPVWWLAYLALLGRAREDGTMEWYPLGRLLAWIAGVSALTFLGGASLPELDYETYRATAAEMAEVFLRLQTATPEGVPIPPLGDVPASAVIEAYVAVLPAIAAASLTIIMVLYLWIGARIVAISGRLVRPWPFIPATMMPVSAAAALLAAGLASRFLDGFLGLAASSLAGALTAAFGIQALAFIHDITRGRPGRGLILFGTYALALFTSGYVLVALALLGIADTVLSLRERFFSGRPPAIVKKPPSKE